MCFEIEKRCGDHVEVARVWGVSTKLRRVRVRMRSSVNIGRI